MLKVHCQKARISGTSYSINHNQRNLVILYVFAFKAVNILYTKLHYVSFCNHRYAHILHSLHCKGVERGRDMFWPVQAKVYSGMSESEDVNTHSLSMVASDLF